MSAPAPSSQPETTAPAPAQPKTQSFSTSSSASRFALMLPNSVCRTYNDFVARPVNSTVIALNSQFQTVRKDYPQAILLSSLAVPLLSAGAGRFAMVRNTVMGVFSASLIVNPALVIGSMALVRDRALASFGLQRPSTVVVQLNSEKKQN